jgi:hypothetical protein
MVVFETLSEATDCDAHRVVMHAVSQLTELFETQSCSGSCNEQRRFARTVATSR